MKTMEIEKILDQLLMPPPACPVSDSLRDISGGSLDRSHGSSTTNSSNSSWISESSCGCHSPRSAVKKSSIVFYRRPILPPLLCGTARSEMLTYRSKALEKERRKRQHSRSKLITRVEAILSSVDMTEPTPSSSQESSPKIPLANSTACEDTDLDSSEKINQLVLDKSDETQRNCEEDSSKETCTVVDDSECVENSATPDKIQTPTEKDVNTSIISSSSSDSDQSFQTEAYRKSLQNLLQKSINSSLNDTFTMPEKPKPEQQIETATSLSGTSSTTTENVWADNTQATIIPKNQNKDASLSSTISHTPSGESVDDAQRERDSAANDCSDTDAIADSMVDSVLEEVRSELTMYASFQIAPASIHINPNETTETENKMDSFTLNASDQDDKTRPDEFEHLSLSCPGQLDQALTIIGSDIACSTDNTATQQHTESSYSSTDSTQDVSPVLSPSLSCGCVATDGQTISSVTPETIVLISSYQKVLESEETPQPPENNESLSPDFSQHSVKEKIDGQNIANESTQSVNGAKNEAVSVPDEDSISPSEAAMLVKRQRQSEGRTRSNSYSTHAPSPLLVSSREEHTIYSTDIDDKACSEVNNDSVFGRDVKRRLEMPSDSEESTVSQPRNKLKESRSSRKGSVSKEEYCKKLEEQHKLEMMELQRQHELQLNKLQQELFQENPQLLEAVGNIGGINLDHLLKNVNENLTPKKTEVPALLSQKNEEMHEGWCKLSALVKGYLTRQLLGCRTVQGIMQTIRDTSRTILTIRSEEFTADTNMKTMQDATLLDRLFLQLRVSMFEFHSMFFDTTVQERMSMIAQSRELDKKEQLQMQKPLKEHRLSSATLKALERKKVERIRKKPALTENSNRSLKTTGPHTKEVKSKISYIWKNGSKPEVGKKTSKQNEKKKKGSKSPYANAKSLVDLNRPNGLAPSIR